MTSTLKKGTSALFIWAAMLCLVGCQSQNSNEQIGNTPKVCTEISSAAP